MLFDIEVMSQKTIKRVCFFNVLFTDKTWDFDHSEHAEGHIYIIIIGYSV